MIYVIRVVLSFEQAQRIDTEGFIDLLGRAGIIKLHRNDRDGVCMDFYPPKSVLDLCKDSGSGVEMFTEEFRQQIHSKKWATEQAARFEGHGFNAVAAPEWKDEEGKLQDAKLVTKKFNKGPNAWCGCGHPHSFDMCDRLNCHPQATRKER